MSEQPRCAQCDRPMTQERVAWDGRAYCSEDCIRLAEQEAHDAWRMDRYWDERDDYGSARMGLWPY